MVWLNSSGCIRMEQEADPGVSAAAVSAVRFDDQGVQMYETMKWATWVDKAVRGWHHRFIRCHGIECFSLCRGMVFRLLDTPLSESINDVLSTKSRTAVLYPMICGVFSFCRLVVASHALARPRRRQLGCDLCPRSKRQCPSHDFPEDLRECSMGDCA